MGQDLNSNEAVSDDVEGHGLLRNAAVAAALTVGGGVAMASPASAGPVEDAQTLVTSSDLATDAAATRRVLGLHVPGGGGDYDFVTETQRAQSLAGQVTHGAAVPTSGSDFHVPADPPPAVWEAVPIEDDDFIPPEDFIEKR